MKPTGKRIGKRLFCLLTALTLIMVQPVWAGALEGAQRGNTTVVTETVIAQDSEYRPRLVESYESTVGIKNNLYNTLNTRQKAIYNAMKNITWTQLMSSSNHMVRANVKGIVGSSYTGYISGGRFIPTGSSVNAYNTMEADVYAGYMALNYDRPDLVWLEKGYTVNYWFEGRGSRYTITQFSIGFALPYGNQANSMRNRIMSEAQSIANVANRERDTYSKVKAVHDILAARSSYNYAALEGGSAGEFEKDLSHSAYSAMFNDIYDPVCEGYAKAFKIVMNLMDIPCVVAVSDDHMWNNVQMDDGLWYNLDLTWDDLSVPLRYDYFLVGSGTVCDGYQTFAQSHPEVEPLDKSFRRSGARYPKKNSAAYAYLGENYPPLRFPDVPRDDYGYEYIEKVAGLGYFSGSNNGNFNPGKQITRAEFASAVAKTLGANTDYYKGLYSFSDVGTSQWYSGVAYWAKYTGLMEGDGVRMRPNDPINREEMCTILKKAYKLTGGYGGFYDDWQISNWAREGVYACRGMGLVNGYEDGTFKPQGKTTRRDAAIVLGKYAEYRGL